MTSKRSQTSASAVHSPSEPHTGRQGTRPGKLEIAPTSNKTKKTSRNAAPIQIGQRAATVAEAIGNRAKLAKLLAVSPSQPTRWIDGTETPNPTNAQTIVDLDYVVARAGLLWKPAVITEWLNGHNAFLDGARPIDVIKIHGSATVIDALDQELSGAYA